MRSKITLLLSNFILFVLSETASSSVETIFDFHHLTQYPSQWWNETYSFTGTLHSCSKLCHVNLCIGFTWNQSVRLCVIWKTIEKGPLHLVVPGETPFPIWLRNGTTIYADGVLTFDKFSSEWNQYIPRDFSLEPSISVPNLALDESNLFGQSFTWGILMCGGLSGTCKKWGFGSESWSNANSLIKKHLSVFDTLGMIGNNLWVIGGMDSGDTDECFSERLSPNGQWILVQQLPRIMYLFGIAPIDASHVLIAGGSARQWLTEVRKYDIILGNWTTVGHYPTETINVGCEKHNLLNGTAIVICVGGTVKNATHSEIPTTYTGIYNIAEDSWAHISEWDLPSTCTRPNIQSVGGRLFIFGGFFANDQRELVLEFKEDSTPVWQELDPLPSRNLITIPYKVPVWYPN